MFICLELDTENATIWEKVDAKLAHELGLTHVVWGEDDKNNTTKCPLPGDCFYGDILLSTAELTSQVEKAIQQVCGVGYNIIVISEDDWSHESHNSPIGTASSSINTDSEVASREV